MSLSHSPSIVTDGLVLYLDAGNRRSYPGNGNTWFDLSGNNLNATLYNSPIYYNKYLYFNGVDSYGEINTGIKQIIEDSSNFSLITFSKVQFIEHVDNLVGWGNANSDASGFSRTFGQYANSSQLNTSYSGPALGNMSSINIIDKWLLLVSRYNNLEYYSDTYGSVRNSTYADQSATNRTWKSIPIVYPVTIAKTSYFSRYMEVNISLIMMFNRFLNNYELKQIFQAFKGRFNL